MGFMTVEENYIRMAYWLHETVEDLQLAKADGSPEVERLEKQLEDAKKAVANWRERDDELHEYRRKEAPIRFFLTNKLSQWAMSDFWIDGVRFNCCEQFMMAMKAAVFKDDESMKKIMAVDNLNVSYAHFKQWSDFPREQKRMGREVKGFDKEAWEKVAQEVVFRGNYAKFSQNPDLWKFLDETGDDHLAESNPKDPIWGIGLGRDDPRATDKAQWQGKNWLGEALMKVRQQIRREKKVKECIASGGKSNWQRYQSVK